MLKELEKLSVSESEVVFKTPMLVCILIAGADNQIDNKEIKRALELARKGRTKATLYPFYKIVSEDFEDKLKIILQSLPIEPQHRTRAVVDELAQLNDILSKIDKSFGHDFYMSLTYIAKQIAESSGGVLGIQTIGDEELELVKLPMIKDPAAT